MSTKQKMEAARRVNESRRLSESLGIIITSVSIPRDYLPEMLVTAQELRAKYMMDIADGSNMDRIRLLAKKRSGWNLANKEQMAKIDLLTGDSRVVARELIERYQKLDNFLSHYDPETTSFDEVDIAKAQRVAVGNTLLSIVAELEL